MTPLKSI